MVELTNKFGKKLNVLQTIDEVTPQLINSIVGNIKPTDGNCIIAHIVVGSVYSAINAKMFTEYNKETKTIICSHSSTDNAISTSSVGDEVVINPDLLPMAVRLNTSCDFEVTNVISHISECDTNEKQYVAIMFFIVPDKQILCIKQ